MRCEDLAGTWREMSAWFDQHRVLVLPQLSADRPLVRLDADIDEGNAARATDLRRVVERLYSVIEHFDVRAVYVHSESGEDGRCGVRGEGEPGGRAAHDAGPAGDGAVSLTVRAVAGGVVHELTLFAAWYAAYLDQMVGTEFAHTS